MAQDNSRYGNVQRYRNEYKYLIDAGQEGILSTIASGVLIKDSHVRDDGAYTIRSAYFDDLNDTCLMENVSGADPRSKFRIRYYNDDTSRIVLEKKSKSRGMCLKESCNLTVSECEAFIGGIVPDIQDCFPDNKKKLFWEVRKRSLFPKVIVTYDRVPFIYPGGNVRVTFDRNITSSVRLDRFLMHDYEQRPILPCGQTIMEVKWDEVLPMHIKDALWLDRMNWTAFSKYYMCRMHHL